MFEKVLIANRGEIALRIARACKELGIATVAVHSSADERALHTRFADQSVRIGPADSARSYLNVPAIIAAAEITGADAIHPGYGYLAEDARFAEICKACGIHFIGPSAKSIRLMGDKLTARQVALKAKTPLIPGSPAAIETLPEALDIADQIGYPVMLKAAGGGGGKGIRKARDNEELEASFELTRAEAGAAFSNNAVYLEKAIENARHIEAQIIADNSARAIHLGARECSIQRRNQKLIEEAMPVNIDPEKLDALLKSSCALAESIGYDSIGTIEYLVDQDDNFYFLEMNTRVQVEHPVTELISGVDIVKEQIRLSAGEPLRSKQSQIAFNSHAIEMRINAEHPITFTPAPGLIRRAHLPGGPGVRIDSALYDGLEISPYYDSLIAKVIAYGPTRQEAIAKARRALWEFHVEGIETTISTCQKVLDSPQFQAGSYDITTLEKILSAD